MKEDIDWNEINEDLIKTKIREGIKFQKKQFDHLLKCDSCMNKFVEIMKCLFQSPSRKKKE
jgi:hypothetical protein